MKLGVIMDPIAKIQATKDSTLAMLLAAQRKGWTLYYMEIQDLFLSAHQVRARCTVLTVHDEATHWFELGASIDMPLTELHVILMRKDPPVDTAYLYATQLLAHAEQQGVFVVNKPHSLSQANEKLFICQFPQCIPETLVSSQSDIIRNFVNDQQDVILKPLHGMGGQGIFRSHAGDTNLPVIIETLTQMGEQLIMVQRYLPEIATGDKRILLINGEPIPYALARLAAAGETRANLARGGHAKGVVLSERDRWICAQLAAHLRALGLLFVGIDVIGDYLTEINVTSPTCIRELDSIYAIDIGMQLMNAIEKQVQCLH